MGMTVQFDPTTARSDLLEELRTIVGTERVKHESVDLVRYRPGPWGYTDLDQVYGWTPFLAVCPRSAEDVAACLAVIARAGFPIVPVTGGTGLTGGSLATSDSIVIDLGDMDEIVAIDRVSRRATVSANIRIESLQNVARAANLLFAHDPWSAPIATVAGTISTNSVGYLAAGYGPMGSQVLGLRVALTTGALLTLTRQPATTAGPDLASLFIGSEGTFGVIVEATVRLHPMPEQERLIGFGFDHFEDAFKALDAAIEARLALAMVDL